MARALAKEGRAQFTGKKAATTGCPGCCGDGPKCCICAAIGVPPDDPCYLNYQVKNDPPPLCNKSASCCCGNRVRMTWKRSSVFDSKQLSKGTGNFLGVHIEYDQEAVFEWSIVTLPDGKCREDYTPISYTLRILDRRNNHFGGNDHFSETLETSDDKDQIDNDLGLLINPHHGCRPEPVWMGCRGGVPPYVELYDDDNEQNPSWCNSLHTHGCNGKGEHFGDDDTLLGTTEWTGIAGCRHYRFDAESEYHQEDGSTDVDRTASGYAEMTLEVLEDNCCPGEPGTPGTPYNPAPPLIPVDPDNPGLGYLCPRCGLKMTGDKCRNCNFCNGCGG